MPTFPQPTDRELRETYLRGTYASVLSDSSRVCHLPLGVDGPFQVRDRSGTVDDATPANASVVAKAGRTALAFNGTSSQIDYGTDSAFDVVVAGTVLPFCVSAWIYAIDNARFRICSRYDDAGDNPQYQFDTGGGQKLQLYCFDSSTDGAIGIIDAVTLPTNQWLHVAGTYDGTSAISAGLALYVNGTRISTTDGSFGSFVTLRTSPSPFRVGSLQNSSFATGYISHLEFFKGRQFSATDVHRLYAQSWRPVVPLSRRAYVIPSVLPGGTPGSVLSRSLVGAPSIPDTLTPGGVLSKTFVGAPEVLSGLSAGGVLSKSLVGAPAVLPPGIPVSAVDAEITGYNEKSTLTGI